jgi:uncharacterized protein
MYFPGLEPAVEKNADLVTVLEVEPQTLWLHRPSTETPYVVDEALAARITSLPGVRILHSVGTPVGGTVGPDEDQVALVASLALRWNTPWVSEHLAFNRARGADGEFSTGFLLAPRMTKEGVETASGMIRRFASGIPVPVAVETGVNYLRPRGDELPEGTFVAATVIGADCGLLLDLHNIWANERNGRQPVARFLDELPLERVWELHLAGGFERHGYWLDAHSGEIPEGVLDVARYVIPRLPNLRSLIFELVPSAIDEFGLDAIRGQIERLWDLWQLRDRPTDGTVLGPGPSARAVGNDNATRTSAGERFADAVGEPGGAAISPEEWESTLGTLVIGRPANGALADQLQRDPGLSILRELSAEIRASVLVSTLKLTSRLLMLRLGPQRFKELLSGYRMDATPQPFGSEEAERFAGYLRSLAPDVQYLDEVLEFELAVIRTLVDGIARTARFSFEPTSVLRALGESRQPGPPAPGVFEITVTGEEPSAHLDEYLARANYWPH